MYIGDLQPDVDETDHWIRGMSAHSMHSMYIRHRIGMVVKVDPHTNKHNIEVWYDLLRWTLVQTHKSQRGFVWFVKVDPHTNTHIT